MINLMLKRYMLKVIASCSNI